MFNLNQGDEIWVLSFYGPGRGVFQMSWPKLDKVLLEFNGAPEIVEMKNCFLSERDCYAAAAEKKQREAMAAMEQSLKYSAKACGKQDGGTE